MTRVLAIIPAFNEAGNVGKIVREILDQPGGIVPLVVDDGSSDSTADEALAAGARVIRLPFNLGIGSAVQTGYRYALKQGFDVAVQVDGDGQHDPSQIKTVVQPILDGAADMVVGSRFLEENTGFQSSFTRRIGIRFFRRLIRLLTGFKGTDPTSGFRACNKKLIRIFAHYYPNDFPEPEAIIVSQRLGAIVREAPVVMRVRQEGKSSIGKLKSPYYMIKVTLAICLHMIKDKKVYGIWR